MDHAPVCDIAEIIVIFVFRCSLLRVESKDAVAERWASISSQGQEARFWVKQLGPLLFCVVAF